MLPRRTILIGALIWAFTSSATFTQNHIPTSVYDQVTASIQQGNLSDAERVLLAALREHPKESRALGLMGVILDGQKRYDEAQDFYNQATQLEPRSAPLLNNLGNHYLEQGDLDHARKAYLKVIVLEPGHPNANLHLAQMSVTGKKGEAALRYLNRLPAGEQGQPAVQLLRAQALHLTGQRAAAEGLLDRVEKQASNEPRVAFSIGMIFADWKYYSESEKAFTHALDAAPANFDILYNLGLAATHAGHLDRAREIFQIALKQRPNDVDCLYDLARVYTEQHQEDQAIVLLVEAQRLAPDRADVVMFLAHTSEALGFHADTAVAYDQYLKLRPKDDLARRERGFASVRGARFEEGLADLRWYVQKYPRNARGLYELGIAETVHERDKALQHFNRALAIDPYFTAALYARAVLLFQAGRAANCADDLTRVLKLEPDNYRALDQLGEAYLTLGRTQEAVDALGHAAELASKDPKVLLHYSRALLKAGRKQESERALVQFQQLGPDPLRRRPYGGLFDYLHLPPAEQQARYMANLRRNATMNPKDPVLKARLGKALLSQGKTDEALAAFRDVRSLSSEPRILADCARVLLEQEQYGAAREFLEPLAGADPSGSDARLDLAIAVFHSDGPAAGLAELDKTPSERRQGDYFLLRAQILDALGKFEEAAENLNRGFRAAPTRPDLYFQAALFLIKHDRYRQAVDLLAQAIRIVPGSPELLLTQAISYELLQQPDDAQRLLTQIESRWPEWSEPYLVNGIMLEIRLKSAQAKPLLENAIALGAHVSIAYYYLALATTHIAPDHPESAEKAIGEALKLNPQDPYVRSLAGKIAFTQKNYKAALEHLTAALHVWPEMIEAHQALSATYRALGDKERAGAELKEIVRIKQENRAAEQVPPSPVRSLLFTVRPSLGEEGVGLP